MQFTRHLTYGFLLLIVLSITGWLRIHHQNRQHPRQKQNSPDAIMYDVTATQMGLNGKPESTIHSPKVVHFDKGETTQLKKPILIHYKKGEKPTYIKANNGKSEKGIEKVTLWGDVHIDQAKGKTNHELHITTESLHIEPEKRFAQTDDNITLSQPGSVVNSKGMRFYLEQGRVELLAQARMETTQIR